MNESIEYAVNFDCWNILWERHENRYDFFKAKSIEEAKAMAYWKYGDLIDILSVEIFE